MADKDPANFVKLLMEAAAWAGDDPVRWALFLKGVEPPVRRRMLAEFFHWQAHGGQREPDGDWRTWVMMAGRGFGKTRAGAEWVAARARAVPGAQIALVGGSFDEVAKVMIEGPSGLLSVGRDDEEMLWVPTRGTVTFASGAEAFVHSAAAFDKLRGPQHHFAWCDELAKWERADEAWDNLQMGLRLGERPRAVVTTTPRAVPVVRRVLGLSDLAVTRGATRENMHVAEAFKQWVVETYGGTRLGRQELDGELIEDVAGALFTREMIEGARVLRYEPSTSSVSTQDERSIFKRVVVGVDPPASVEGACGIVVCGLGADGIVYVLADCSVAGARPEAWARAVASAAEAWGADRVIAEKNQGGDMVESVLRSVDCALPVKLVSASRGKAARAEPVAARFEQGKARLAGRFPELEDELAGLTLGGGYEGPGRSPDRADAMVWAVTELMRPRAEPRVLAL